MPRKTCHPSARAPKPPQNELCQGVDKNRLSESYVGHKKVLDGLVKFVKQAKMTKERLQRERAKLLTEMGHDVG